MDPTRRLFLEASDVALRLLRSPETSDAWESPSVLREFSVRGLAGHLARATTSVEAYLDRDRRPAGEPFSAARYYAAVLTTSDITHPFHAAVRDRGEKEAERGHEGLIEHFSSSLERLRSRLQDEPEDRLIKVFQDVVLPLNEYLATRLVETCVHVDDLAASVGLPTPELPAGAVEMANSVLIEVARLRHGDLAVLRALSRRERDEIEALRVL
jgi:uncharacterized protein (TIGR03083 family)